MLLSLSLLSGPYWYTMWLVLRLKVHWLELWLVAIMTKKKMKMMETSMVRPQLVGILDKLT